MRVLMFGWEYPPVISGGLGMACFGLTRSLSRMGVEVTFVLPRIKEVPKDSPVKLIGANQVDLDATWSRLIDEGNLKLLRIDSSLRPYVNDEQYRDMMRRRMMSGDLGGGGLLDLTGDYGENLMAEVDRYAKVARALALTEEFEVIHAHDWMTFPAGVAAKHASGKPLVLHVHATEFDRSGELVNQQVYDIERYGLENADRIIAVSGRTKAMIIERYGIHPDKVDVVYNGVIKEEHTDRSQSGKSLNGKIVLFLGRVTMQKGPDYFLEAAHLVLQKLKNVRFVMAGAGDMLPRMIERMAQLRILEHFHFTGFLRGDKREKIFAMSDLYVMPSVSEPFGLTPVEAMQYDVPIIVSNQSGVAEVLSNVIKVDFWETRKLADAIIEVLTNPKLARRIVEDSRAELELIDWDRAAASVNEIYYRVSAG